MAEQQAGGGMVLRAEHEEAIRQHLAAQGIHAPEGISIGDILTIGGKILNAALAAAVTGEFDVPVKGIRLGPGGTWDLDVKGHKR